MIKLPAEKLALIIAAIYVGLLLGVSFFAAPIKFTADNVGMEQLLAVGKVTFQSFTWVEFAAFALLVASTMKIRVNKVMVCMALLLLLLLIQKFGVLPGLDSRLDQTVAGSRPESSNLHNVYVILESIKLVILCYLTLALATIEANK